MVSRYNQSVKTQLKQKGIIQSLSTLYQLSLESWNQQMEQQYNTLYLQQLLVRQNVEKHIRKLKTGGIPWSPRLQLYRDKIELWEMVVKKRRHVRTSTSKIKRLMKKTMTPDALRTPLDHAVSARDKAYKEYKEC